MVKVCLNGDRGRGDHPGVPITPAELAREAEAAVRAGAQAIHLHPRGADEKESLGWADVRVAVEAVRARCPGVPIGVSTRQEIVPDLWERLALLAEWVGQRALYRARLLRGLFKIGGTPCTGCW